MRRRALGIEGYINMNHYCLKCNHLFNSLLEKCPKCGTSRDYFVSWGDEIGKTIWNIRKNAYCEGFEDGVKMGKLQE